MQTDKSLSFTATLHMDQDPVCILGEHTDGPMTVAHPYSQQSSDLSQALGVLIGPDEAWEEDRAVGLIDFHLTSPLAATTLYFRHVHGAYRLYVRSGEHFGQGIYLAGNTPYTQPVIGEDPNLWAILQAGGNGDTCTLSELADISHIHLKRNSDSAALAMLGIGIGVGGFLEASTDDPAATLTLKIIEREVDWLN